MSIMGCAVQFFPQDLTQNSLIDRLWGLAEVKPQSLVDHGLISEVRVVSNSTKIMRNDRSRWKGKG